MKLQKNGLDEFIALMDKAPDKEMQKALYDFFLTAEEISDLSRRLLIIKALLAGKKSQREIAKELNVSIAKITRGSNELKRTNKKLIDFLIKVIG